MLFLTTCEPLQKKGPVANATGPFSIQRHALLVYFDEAIGLHMAQFPGYGGPVGTEVIGQLGPGHGDGEGRAASLFGLEGKVRQQFLAQRFFGNDFELFQELGILIGHEAEWQSCLPSTAG